MQTSLLSRAKRTASARSLRSTFVSENGAIDLASIMVGIIVIGLIGGVIAATVFAVIPWAQDNAAKASLASVVTAENVYSGLAASPDADNSASLVGASVSTRTVAQAESGKNFATYDQLLDQGLIGKPSQYLGAATGQDGSCYVAASLSQTGKVFYTENGGKTQQTTAEELPNPDCTGDFPVIEKLGNTPNPSDGSGSGGSTPVDCSHGGPNCGSGGGGGYVAPVQFKFSVISTYIYPIDSDGTEGDADAHYWNILCTQSDGGCEVEEKPGTSVVPQNVRDDAAKLYTESYVANAAADATDACGFKDTSCLNKELSKSFPESTISYGDGSRLANLGLVGLRAISND
ncbi:hypothetical protein [Curtobacterium sp. MCBA15_001]|uniref:hypothetical protein n=1 Tax=Curtobacterium sp. MCBA15_001 TaxID=1898731 RepID=UPI001113557A|nr:hypothetical protein [Curtobacterium sp. MCBA15_001]